ncbi:MAG: cytochrome c biogenesis protein CcsA [Candidatus Omnitrophica bacterium]|nr:cytochrome c biogenesis protein CcsA [Candidatus Omnitrophota bacterium]
MIKKTALIFFIAFLLCGNAWAAKAQSVNPDPLKYLLIQDGGRVKPVSTFFMESMLVITGKARFENEDPTALCLAWISDPRAYEQKRFILLAHESLKRMIQADLKRKYFSALELAQNQEFQKFLKEVDARQKDRKKLNNTELEALRLYGRLDRFYGIAQGTALKIVPFNKVSKNAWISPVDLMPGHELAEGMDVKLRFDFLAVFGTVVQTFKTKEKSTFNTSAKILVAIQEKIAASSGINFSKYPIRQEIFYNALAPFARAWKLYLLAFLFLLTAAFWKNIWIERAGFFVFASGFLIHTLGFVLRSWIAGRPPVSNMYESVIWVSWGVVFFASILGVIYRQKIYILAAALVSAIALILASSTATVLNPQIATLEPVLRSNFWLTIHVMTITLSYAAFALAFGIGHYNLYLYGWGKASKEKLRAVNLYVYRAIQIGVILLAAGTILGGVWANYSWGRFWGWDPKEVWALIALLGYLTILHGRHAGWLREFGMAVGSVIAFLGVLMAWYGVNFVLGVGLHSYGFGGGGLSYILTAVIFDLGFVGFVSLRHLQVSPTKGKLANKQ